MVGGRSGSRALILAAALGCFVLFVMSGVVATLGRAGTGIDRSMFDLVVESRNLAVIEAANDIVPLGQFAPLLALALLCAGSLLIRKIDRFSAVIPLLAMVITAAVVSVMKRFVARPGPGLLIRLAREGPHSFPSGHAALSAAVLISIGLVATVDAGLSRSVRLAVLWVCAVTCGLVSASTVVLYMHWPADAVAGSSLGAMVALVVFTAVRSFQTSRSLPRPDSD